MKIDSHKFAYRLLLLSVLLSEHTGPGLLRDLLKLTPYVLLSFDMYSPKVILQKLANSRKFRLFLVVAYLGLSLKIISGINYHLPQYHSAMREDVIVQIENHEQVEVTLDFIPARVTSRSSTHNL